MIRPHKLVVRHTSHFTGEFSDLWASVAPAGRAYWETGPMVRSVKRMLSTVRLVSVRWRRPSGWIGGGGGWPPVKRDARTRCRGAEWRTWGTLSYGAALRGAGWRDRRWGGRCQAPQSQGDPRQRALAGAPAALRLGQPFVFNASSRQLAQDDVYVGSNGSVPRGGTRDRRTPRTHRRWGRSAPVARGVCCPRTIARCRSAPGGKVVHSCRLQNWKRSNARRPRLPRAVAGLRRVAPYRSTPTGEARSFASLLA